MKVKVVTQAGCIPHLEITTLLKVAFSTSFQIPVTIAFASTATLLVLALFY